MSIGKAGCSVTLMMVLTTQALAQEATGEDAGAARILDEITVTGSREGVLKSETPATVDLLSGKAILQSRPTHAREVMNQIPGVWVSSLSGEGHSTSIRHPLTTSPVYLYLEDGVPTRSTGFFNHNALYEINIPQAGGIEVSKGPGSALYGSDAIGGTVNVLTRTPPPRSELEMTGEGGQNGWGRLLVSGGDTFGSSAWRGNLNLTRTDGWHDHSEYDRQAGSLRWDQGVADNAVLKVVTSFAHIDQNHVGELSQAEYHTTPRKNNAPISYRQVDALRVSTAYEQEEAGSLVSLTPYYRRNGMAIVPNWSLSYDPSRYTTRNQSFGLLGKYRQDFTPMRARLIGGVDVDVSPGSHTEEAIKVTRVGNVYTRFDSPTRIYDYDVTFRSVSPYLQGEISPLERMRLTAGLRYDDMHYDYDNRLADRPSRGPVGAFPSGGWYGHVADTTVGYRHWSPKLGMTYLFADELNGFLNYSNTFRTPSQGQVFRGPRESTAARAQIAAASQLQLRPVQVDNLETGLRGKSGGVSYEVSVYYMTKSDDILSHKDPVTTQSRVVNAGKTLHRGLELGLGAALTRDWQLDLSLSLARHTYQSWAISGTADYRGKEMEAAPHLISSTRLTWSPEFLQSGRIQVEWTQLGSYWQDAANTRQYPGHDLFNLRTNYPIDQHYELYANFTNIFDQRFAETSSLAAGSPVYTAGLPFTMLAGIQAKW